MSEPANEEPSKVEARLGSDLKFSRVWLVPLVALVIGVWMTYAHFSGLGQIVEITFESGEGIQRAGPIEQVAPVCGRMLRSSPVCLGVSRRWRWSVEAEDVHVLRTVGTKESS